MLRTTTVLLLALSWSAPAVARPIVDLTVIDRTSGQQLPQARHRGQRWIAGEPGHSYAVRLTNTSDERVLVVLSVDGVNAVTGEVADPSQAGYVLAPWQSIEIAGWRKSYQDVARFVFTASADSYAARTGRPENVGVIGIAVFQEARAHAQLDAPSPPPHAAEAGAPARQASESMQGSSMADSSAQQIGTGHGAREWSPVASTSFVRATATPFQVVALRYDDHASLVARGILPPRLRHHEPQAFPTGFVADPPKHRGWDPAR